MTPEIIKKEIKRNCPCGNWNAKCKICNGKGYYYDYIYTMIVNGKSIAMDTLK